jgi:hypothetical protein
VLSRYAIVIDFRSLNRHFVCRSCTCRAEAGEPFGGGFVSVSQWILDQPAPLSWPSSPNA